MTDPESDDPYVEPGMPWPRKLLICVAVLQVAIIGLQASMIFKWPEDLYWVPDNTTEVDLTPVTGKLDGIASELIAVTGAAREASNQASAAESAARKISSDIAMQSITGVRCSRY